jgi:hypothetical protein
VLWSYYSRYAICDEYYYLWDFDGELNIFSDVKGDIEFSIFSLKKNLQGSG